MSRERDVGKWLSELPQKCPYIIEHYNVSPMEGKFIHFAMEHYDDGDLFEYINDLREAGIQLEEDEIKRIFRQMATAIKFLHDRNVAHRDVKPENFVIKKSDKISPDGIELIDHVKLIDFGHTISFEPGQIFTECLGTPGYRGPEMHEPYYSHQTSNAVHYFHNSKPMLKRPRNVAVHCKYQAPPLDIYSLGISLYMLLENCFPPQTQSGRIKRLVFVSDHYRYGRILSSGARNLIRDMLHADPTKRLTIDQVLAHEWFVSNFRVCKNIQLFIHHEIQFEFSQNIYHN